MRTDPRDPNVPSPELDPRPISFGLLSAATVGYDMSLKQMVNPTDRRMVGLYGAAAVDVSRFLLATNAEVGYFVNRYYANARFVRKGPMRGDVYVDMKRRYGWNASEITLLSEGIDVFTDIEYFDGLLLELAGLGVSDDEVHAIESSTRDRFGLETDTEIAFEWCYWGRPPRRRTLHFLDVDMTRLETLEDCVPPEPGRLLRETSVRRSAAPRAHAAVGGSQACPRRRRTGLPRGRRARDGSGLVWQGGAAAGAAARASRARRRDRAGVSANGGPVVLAERDQRQRRRL